MTSFTYTTKIVNINDDNNTMVVQYTPDITKPEFCGLTHDGGITAPGHDRVMFQIELILKKPEASVNLEEYLKTHAPRSQWLNMIEMGLADQNKTFANVQLGQTIVVDNHSNVTEPLPDMPTITGSPPQPSPELVAAIQKILMDMQVLPPT